MGRLEEIVKKKKKLNPALAVCLFCKEKYANIDATIFAYVPCCLDCVDWRRRKNTIKEQEEYLPRFHLITDEFKRKEVKNGK